MDNFKLPDATTLATGTTYIFDNDSNGTLTIQDSTKRNNINADNEIKFHKSH
jgi:hypothetical protein